jgi:beta-lactamase regulating signal transducer with metallopeptidase domain
MPVNTSETRTAVEIERIKGDIRIIQKSIETIEQNHLKHIESDVGSIKKVLWAVGFLLVTQMLIVIRELLLGVGI